MREKGGKVGKSKKRENTCERWRDKGKKKVSRLRREAEDRDAERVKIAQH